MFGAVCGISTPSYVFITILIVVVAIQLHWVPTGGWGGIFDSRIIIPAVTLALAPTASIARYTRASVLEVLLSRPEIGAQRPGVPGVLPPLVFSPMVLGLSYAVTQVTRAARTRARAAGAS
jgi:hypothetical protein